MMNHLHLIGLSERGNSMGIRGIEVYLPQNVVTNEDLKKEFPDWDCEKIETQIGIKQRHVASSNETSLDLGLKAAEKLLARFDKNEIDFVLYCTQNPDYFMPSSACIIQEKLGLRNDIGALSYNLGCSAYIYGLAMAKGLLSGNIATHILFITSETITKHIYKKDIANRAVFGDAASATLISKDEDMGKSLGEFVLGTDGSGMDKLIVKNGGFANPYNPEAMERAQGTNQIFTDNNLYMDGLEIFNFTINRVPPLVKDVLKKNNFSIDDIDYVVFHQANSFILEYLRKKSKISKEKFHIDLRNSGNTSSTTIPIALTKLISDGSLKKDMKVLLVGFGVGLSWGATIITI